METHEKKSDKRRRSAKKKVSPAPRELFDHGLVFVQSGILRESYNNVSVMTSSCEQSFVRNSRNGLSKVVAKSKASLVDDSWIDG